MAKGFGNEWRGLSPNDPRIKGVIGGTIPSGSFPSGESVKPKYGNVKTRTADGVLCDSKKEAARWAQLRLEQDLGLIRDLMPHPSFPLYVNGTRTGRFSGDAAYVRDGRLVIEDTKSRVTAGNTAYRQRVNTFRACYPHVQVEEWLG